MSSLESFEIELGYCRGDAPRTESFISPTHFRSKLSDLERQLPIPHSAVVRDLMDIASSVYFADRMTRRQSTLPERDWARDLSLNIQVRIPALWGSSEVKAHLTDTLCFLTGDNWMLSFSSSQGRKRSYSGATIQPPSMRDAVVCLYSGGLDSCAGVCSVALSGRYEKILPLIVWHRGDLKRKALTQLDRIGRLKLPGSPIEPLSSVKFEMKAPRVLDHMEEPTQRSRSFLFLCSAAALAMQCGSNSVALLESGVGAVNIPLLLAMTTSRATRSCHPAFLSRTSNFLRVALQQPDLHVILPNLGRTKGELVRGLVEAGGEECISLTASCVKYPRRFEGPKQCGLCPACILRRQSVRVAGVSESAETYSEDFFSWGDLAQRKGRRQIGTGENLVAFMLMLQRLQRIRNTGGLNAAIGQHLDRAWREFSEVEKSSVVSVVCRYCDEWMAVLRELSSAGRPWADKFLQLLNANRATVN